jgi:hypothetical protein
MSSTRFNPVYPLLEDPDGNGATFNRDDILPSQKDTLGSYLSSLTKGTIPGQSSGQLFEQPFTYDGQLPPNHANPFPVADAGSQPVFTDQPGLAAAVDLSTLPDSIFSDQDMNPIVQTGGLGTASGDIRLTGHELLPGVVGATSPDGKTITQSEGAYNYARSIGDALKSKNLNSGGSTVSGGDGETTQPDKSFSSDKLNATNATSRRVILGDTLTGNMKSVSYSVSNPETRDFKKVSQDMMNAAMGKVSEDKRSAVQTGQARISADEMRAGSAPGYENFNRTTIAISSGDDAFESGELLSETGRYTTDSIGTAYGPDDPFTGFDTGNAAYSAFVIGGAFIGAVLGASAAGVVIPPIAPASVPAEINSGLRNTRKLKSGNFRYEPAEGGLFAGFEKGLEIAGNLTGIGIDIPIYVPTNPKAGFGDCVVAGLASWLGVTYGIDIKLILGGGTVAGVPIPVLNGNTGIILAEIAVRLAALLVDPVSRQYYMTMIRALNRDTASLTLKVSNVGDALASTNALFNSALFKFVNTLAKIGDMAYTQAAAIDLRVTDAEASPDAAYGEGFDFKNPVNALLARGFATRRVYGDKLAGRRGSTLSLSDLPSAHLVPAGSSQVYHSLLGNDARLTKFIPSGSSGRTAKRISQADAQKIESILDAEYMPFYFQDLRTNEVIAFHAFLDDVTDSYTANYNASSGYGRIENVQTYKDTKRSVGCTFHIIGMNPTDFDYMWWQINKLTTMVYPQWSQGRSLQTGDGINFSQPFSQIPTATPVIRVRIGDLIRSNYSRFNLKRLFGYQDTEKGQSQKLTDVSYTVGPGTFNVCTASGTTTQSTGTVTLTEKKRVISRVKASTLTPGAAGIVVLLPDGQRILLDSVLSLDPDFTGTNDAGSLVTDFYNPAENSVVRSFESAMGMGLAAVVTSLNFTWMDALWGVGEDGSGNRAPRSCKVQMNFEPIHDIAPGLDHEGFNRAPIYPVGNLVNGIIEGGEQEPYGPGTQRRSEAASKNTADKQIYEQAIKPNTFKKLF